MMEYTDIPYLYNYCNKRPGAMHFSKRGATITDKQNHISSLVAMGDNGYLLP